MAHNKNGRGKTKGDKKKKEEKVIPVAMDITVNLPDETHIILKGISTDRIIDVRRLLSVNTATCNITNFSLSHEVRGPRLKDTVDISALKPCVLTLVEEDYDEESATSHVKRLLDIVACTTCFGPSNGDSGEKSVEKSSKPRRNGKDKRSPSPAASAAAATVDEDGEMSNSCLKLGRFYEFFSLSHLTPPLQYENENVKTTSPQADLDVLDEDDVLVLDAA